MQVHRLPTMRLDANDPDPIKEFTRYIEAAHSLLIASPLLERVSFQIFIDRKPINEV